MTNKVHKKVRFPKVVIDLLRDLKFSHITPRPIPELVNCCLKQTRSKMFLRLHTTRDNSMPIDIWIDDEFDGLEPQDIVGRTAHALIGIQCKFIPENIKMHREGFGLEWNLDQQQSS